MCAVVALLVESCGGGSFLDRLVTPSARLRLDTPTEKRAAFARAYESYRRGDLATALPIFEQLVRDSPELADYDLYFTGVINQRLGYSERAEAAFGRLLRDYPDSVQAPAAALALGQLLIAAGRVDQGKLSLWTALNAPDASTVEAARLAMAEADERSGDLASASAQYMQVRHTAPGSTAAQTAKQHVIALRAEHPELVPTGSALLEEARLLLAEKDYASAKVAATELSERHDGVEPTDILRVLADALYGLGETERALAVLRELAERYPDSAAAPDAAFRRASILWNRDRDSEALRAFEDFRRRYPQDERAAEALYAIGRIHQQAGRGTAAITTYREVATRYPHSKFAGEAQWRVGWIQFQVGNWTAAAATFGQVAERDELRDAAAYWRGRALERAGRSAAARQLYRGIVQRSPNGYYALWAQRRLGEVSTAALLHGTGTVVAPTPPATVPLPQVPDTFHLVRADELKAAGVNALARQELAATERAYDYDVAVQRYLVSAYQSVDAYNAALRLARRLGSQADLSPAEEQQLRYPLAFWETVRRTAEAQDIDPLLVVAIIRQESMFDPTARSSADARGLMQLLPSTAERVAATTDRPIDHTNLNDPDVNIELGTRYLRTLFTRFAGDPFKAIAAYNGGENAVAKWQRQFADLSTDEFVESITYRETRDYVKKVVANYRAYQQQYGSTEH
jgi:soluble lytic murein transglycosylase